MFDRSSVREEIATKPAIEIPESVKITLVGSAGSGKTSVIRKYVTGTFDRQCPPTIMATRHNQKVNIDSHSIALELMDTSGNEHYRSLAPIYYRGARIVIVVFDVTSRESFDSAASWLKEVKEEGTAEVLLVCGNKIDQDGNRVIDSSTARSWAESEGCLYAECSSLTGAGIDNMFQVAVDKLIHAIDT